MAKVKNTNKNGTKKPVQEKNLKTIFWARFWWLFGGIFGAHHFYLNRYDHGLVNFLTFGGFGVGWIRDFFRLSTYVLDTNEDHEYIEWYKAQIRKFLKPPFSASRYLGEVLFSFLLGQLWFAAIPEEEIHGYNLKPLIYLTPLVVALGVWFVGNIGRECGAFWIPLISCYLLYPTLFYLEDSTLWISAMSSISAWIFDSFSKRWRLSPRKKLSLKKTITIVLVVSTIYYGAWASYFYYNATITDSEGEEIKMSEVVNLLFKGSTWLEAWAALKETVQLAYDQGFWTFCRQLIDVSETKGEMHAYSILGLSQTCSQSELTAKWRSLSKEHHPDKVKGSEEEKRKAELYFMKIQEAYEILSKVKYRRQKRNRKSAS